MEKRISVKEKHFGKTDSARNCKKHWKQMFARIKVFLTKGINSTWEKEWTWTEYICTKKLKTMPPRCKVSAALESLAVETLHRAQWKSFQFIFGVSYRISFVRTVFTEFLADAKLMKMLFCLSQSPFPYAVSWKPFSSPIYLFSVVFGITFVKKNFSCVNYLFHSFFLVPSIKKTFMLIH